MGVSLSLAGDDAAANDDRKTGGHMFPTLTAGEKTSAVLSGSITTAATFPGLEDPPSVISGSPVVHHQPSTAREAVILRSGATKDLAVALGGAAGPEPSARLLLAWWGGGPPADRAAQTPSPAELLSPITAMRFVSGPDFNPR
jgi:hypothetical protein